MRVGARLPREIWPGRVACSGAVRTITLGACLGFAGCADSTTEPPVTPAVVIDAPVREVVIGSANVLVNARVPGRPSAPISVRVRDESRWLSEDPVLNPLALADGRIVPQAPGRVRVEFAAEGATPAELSLTAVLAQPTVLHVVNGDPVQPGDTVHLRGFRLPSAATEVAVAGTVTALLPVDSATARFVVPSLALAPRESGCAATATLPFAVTGVANGAQVVLSRAMPRTRLDPGAWRRLTAQQASCLRLEATGSRYVLAWLDPTGVVDSGALAPVGFDRRPEPHSITFAERGTPTAAGGAVQRLRPLAGETPVPAPDATSSLMRTSFVASVARSGAPAVIARDTFVVGDTLTFFPDRFGASAPFAGRVYAVYGRVPFIGPRDAEAVIRERILPAMDVVGPVIDTILIPLLRRTTVDALLGTASGYAPVVMTNVQASAGSANSMFVALAYFDHVEMIVSAGTSFVSPSLSTALLRAIASPLVARYVDAANGFLPAEPRPAGAQRLQEWAHHATVDLLIAEAARRASGVPWASNYDFAAADGTRPFGNYPLTELLGGGQLSRGLSQAGVTYLRDLVTELTARHGESIESALQRLARSAPFGLYGCYQSSCRPDGGLVALMRTFTPDFDPTVSLLRFVLSQAADDQAAHADFNNPHYLFAGARWFTALQLRAGSGRVQSLESLPSGHAGYVILDDNGVGGVYEVISNRPIELALLRLPD